MPQLQIFLSEDNQTTHELAEEAVTVGRLADNTLQIDDASVSSHHAKIQLEGDRYHLHDFDSTNGTFVNGEQVTDAILRHGDEVRFGRIETVFTSHEEAGASQPLPESSAVVAEVATQSARPENFYSSSPIPKKVVTRDPLGMAIIGVAVIAILSFGAAVYYIFGLPASV